MSIKKAQCGSCRKARHSEMVDQRYFCIVVLVSYTRKRRPPEEFPHSPNTPVPLNQSCHTTLTPAPSSFSRSYSCTLVAHPGYLLKTCLEAECGAKGQRLGVGLLALLLLHLEKECTVDVRKDTSEGDRGLNQGVELFVTADRKLQVTWRDTLDLKILRGVACQLEHFGGKILQDGGNIDGGLGSNAHLVLGLALQETLDTTAWEL